MRRETLRHLAFTGLSKYSFLQVLFFYAHPLPLRSQSSCNLRACQLLRLAVDLSVVHMALVFRNAECKCVRTWRFHSQGMHAGIVPGSLWKGGGSSCDGDSKAAEETQVRRRCQWCAMSAQEDFSPRSRSCGCRQQEQGKDYVRTTQALWSSPHISVYPEYWMWSCKIRCFSSGVSVLLWYHSSFL